jgi:hypothetical protein
MHRRSRFPWESPRIRRARRCSSAIALEISASASPNGADTSPPRSTTIKQLGNCVMSTPCKAAGRRFDDAGVLKHCGSVASEHPRTCVRQIVDVLVHSFECCDPKPRLLLPECHALALLGLDGARLRACRPSIRTTGENKCPGGNGGRSDQRDNGHNERRNVQGAKAYGRESFPCTTRGLPG